MGFLEGRKSSVDAGSRKWWRIHGVNPGLVAPQGRGAGNGQGDPNDRFTREFRVGVRHDT